MTSTLYTNTSTASMASFSQIFLEIYGECECDLVSALIKIKHHLHARWLTGLSPCFSNLKLWTVTWNPNVFHTSPPLNSPTPSPYISPLVFPSLSPSSHLCIRHCWSFSSPVSQYTHSTNRIVSSNNAYLLLLTSSIILSMVFNTDLSFCSSDKEVKSPLKQREYVDIKDNTYKN